MCRVGKTFVSLYWNLMQMKISTTDKPVCRELATLLYEHGVRHIVVSPGSRNAPIIVGLVRSEKFQLITVIDERSAGFVGVGIASQSDCPVAVVCTSGSALLNYAPAVSEAYYRRLPLIVISADRPREWIDQDDSQTIRQSEALGNYVKNSYDIPDIDSPNNMWYANRMINDAMLTAKTGRKAPVHINIQLDEPLNGMAETDRDVSVRKISTVMPNELLSVSNARAIGHRLEGKKVMIVAGFHEPDQRLNKALMRIANTSNAVVLSESISNLHSPNFITRIDTTLSAMTETEQTELTPDIVITLGGALVSRFVKRYIRDHKPNEHWHIGMCHTTVDCFKSLTLRIEMDAGIFMSQLASAIHPLHLDNGYAKRWRLIADRADSTHKAYVVRSEWSDLKAFATMMPVVPRRWNLQLSNGTPIRYAQLFNLNHIHRCDCNRGVSGIDGCTSTAIGASMVYTSAPTLLITGDMSAQYDIGALACKCISPRFKMVVMLNGGGGIFRFINSTSNLPELEDFFAIGVDIPLRQLADGYGFRYFEASDEASLRSEFKKFAEESHQPAILAVKTPAVKSADILRDYFKRHQILNQFKRQNNNGTDLDNN